MNEFPHKETPVKVKTGKLLTKGVFLCHRGTTLVEYSFRCGLNASRIAMISAERYLDLTLGYMPTYRGYMESTGRKGEK